MSKDKVSGKRDDAGADDILRSVENLGVESRPAISSLSGFSEPDLFAALAQRLNDRRATLATPFNADDLKRDAALQALGQRVFRRWNMALYDFVCKSKAEDQQLRERLISALSGKEGGAAALIAGTLVAAFGASPAVAAIIGTLVVRIVIIPATEELCSYWNKTIEQGANRKVG